MIESINSLPVWAGCVLVMSASTVSGILVYFVSHRLISRYQREELKDPIGSLFRVIGMLVSLMLSLAFAEVIVDLRKIENATKREIVSISDTFSDLQSFDEDKTRSLRGTLIEYTQAVAYDDWPALARDRLGVQASILKRQLADDVMNLAPSTPAQEALWSRILADVDAISDYRLIRLDGALSEPPIYIYVVLFGFLVTMACFGAFRPQGPLVALVSLYTFFIGLVVYLIIALSDPFHGGIGLEPTPFEHLAKTLQTEMK